MADDKRILLLTGTIAPSTMAPSLGRTDALVRLNDYKNALRQNLQLIGDLFDKVVFVENSGYGMGAFEPIVERAELQRSVELISFDDVSQKPGVTRFCGETRLMLEALQRSEFIRDLPGDAFIWKLTGRYTVRNIKRILGGADNCADVFLHCRKTPSRYVDYGLVGLRKSAARPFVDRISGRSDFEEVSEDILCSMLDDGAFGDLKISRRFTHIPDFSGVRGYDQASYDGIQYRLKFFIRQVANRLAPGLWL